MKFIVKARSVLRSHGHLRLTTLLKPKLTGLQTLALGTKGQLTLHSRGHYRPSGPSMFRDLGLLCSLTQRRARSVVECVVSAGCVISIQTKM